MNIIWLWINNDPYSSLQETLNNISHFEFSERDQDSRVYPCYSFLGRVWQSPAEMDGAHFVDACFFPIGSCKPGTGVCGAVHALGADAAPARR